MSASRRHLASLASLLLMLAFGSADSSRAATDAELKKTMATFINLNGLLCAKAIDIRPLQLPKKYEVTCVQYRGGTGTVRYIFDAETGVAFKAN